MVMDMDDLKYVAAGIEARGLLNTMYNDSDDINRGLARVTLEARASVLLNALLGTHYGYPDPVVTKAD